MRITVIPPFRFGYADLAEYAQNLCLCLLRRYLTMQQQRFTHLKSNTHHRVKARHRLLKNHTYLLAAYSGHLMLRELQQLRACELYTAADDSARVVQKPHDGARRHALPAARLANNADYSSARDGYGHIINGFDLAILCEEAGT